MEELPPPAVAEFRRRLWSQVFATVAFFGGWIGLRASGAFKAVPLDTVGWFVVLGLTIAAYGAFTLRNWRCPVCGKYPASGPVPFFCRRCESQLLPLPGFWAEAAPPAAIGRWWLRESDLWGPSRKRQQIVQTGGLGVMLLAITLLCFGIAVEAAVDPERWLVIRTEIWALRLGGVAGGCLLIWSCLRRLRRLGPGAGALRRARGILLLCGGGWLALGGGLGLFVVVAETDQGPGTGPVLAAALDRGDFLTTACSLCALAGVVLLIQGLRTTRQGLREELAAEAAGLAGRP